jgi:hypothetical protein
MSLTSYRAAPPRVTLVSASPVGWKRNRTERQGADQSVPRLPEKATRAKANGCGAYVSTPAPFGKAQSCAFEDFVTAKTTVFLGKFVPRNRSCQNKRKSGGLPRKSCGGHA